MRRKMTPPVTDPTLPLAAWSVLLAGYRTHRVADATSFRTINFVITFIILCFSRWFSCTVDTRPDRPFQANAKPVEGDTESARYIVA